MAKNAVEIVIKALDATRGGFASAQKNVQSFGAAAKAMAGLALTAGAAVGTAFIASAKAFAENADELGKMSEKTGIATETLSKLKFVAEENNLSWEQMQKAFRGASIEASKSNQTFEQLLTGTADRFSSLADGAGKAAEAQRLFGKGGADLIPILNLGSEGLKKAIKDAEEFTTVIDSKTAAAADAFGDNIGRIGSSVKKTFNEALKSAMPYLLSFSESLLEIVKKTAGSHEAISLIGDAVRSLGKAAAITAASFAYLQTMVAGAADILTEIFIGGSADITESSRATEEALRASADRIKKIWNDELVLPDLANRGGLGEIENPLDVEKYNRAWMEMGRIGEEGSQRILSAIQMEGQKRVESIKDLQVSEQAKNDFILQNSAIVTQQKEQAEARSILFLADLELARDEGKIKRTVEMLATEEATNAARLANNQAFIDVYTQQWMIASQTITGFLASTFGAFSQSFGAAIGETLRDFSKAGDAVKKFGQAMVASVTNFIGQWIAAKVTMMAMELIFGKTVAAATVGTALIIGAAWATPAALASLATLGGNAAGANAALASTVAFSKGLSVVGAAHGGLDYVPQESTYLLDKGERVLSPNQNAQLMEFLNGGGGGGNSVVEVHLDGEVLGRGIGRMSRDGRVVISASAIA